MQDDCITIALGLPEVEVVQQKETEKGVVVEVKYRVQSVLCPRCGERTPKVHSSRPQRKRDWRLRGKGVFLVLHKRRFRYLRCKKVFSEPDSVFGARWRSSQRFREHLGREAIERPVRHVASREGVGEGLVRRCVTEETQRLLGAPKEPTPARILGLDEFCIRKGQVYDTAVMDIEKKQVLGVVSGHRGEEVQKFLERLPYPEQVQVAVMDMHEPFRQAVEMCLPRAKVVTDKFHVLMHVHRALDQVRTSLQPKVGRKGEPFRARFLLLKAVERLTPEGYARLIGLLGRYPLLRKAWALKEASRTWYHSHNRLEAEAGLRLWEEAVRECGLRPLQDLFPVLRN